MKQNVNVCDSFEFENFIDHFFEQNCSFFVRRFWRSSFRSCQMRCRCRYCCCYCKRVWRSRSDLFWSICECESEFWFSMFLIRHKIRIKKRDVVFRRVTAGSGFGQMSDSRTVLGSDRTAITVRRRHVMSKTLIASCMLAIDS